MIQNGNASNGNQGHASGSGSGSRATTTAYDDPHPRLENALPLTDSGSGSGGGPGSYSGSATVTGKVWLDNNGDGSIDDNEMDYADATVNLFTPQTAAPIGTSEVPPQLATPHRVTTTRSTSGFRSPTLTSMKSRSSSPRALRRRIQAPAKSTPKAFPNRSACQQEARCISLRGWLR